MRYAMALAVLTFPLVASAENRQVASLQAQIDGMQARLAGLEDHLDQKIGALTELADD